MLKALGHHILVKVVEQDEKTSGGIVIPERVRDAERRAAEIAEVVDIGPTAYKAEGLGGVPWVQVGDRVWFAKYAGKWVNDPSTKQEYLILADMDIMVRIEESH